MPARARPTRDLCARARARRLKDGTFRDILAFLDAMDSHGKSVPTKIQDHPDKPVDKNRHNVSYEARILKKMYLKLRD